MSQEPEAEKENHLGEGKECDCRDEDSGSVHANKKGAAAEGMWSSLGGSGKLEAFNHRSMDWDQHETNMNVDWALPLVKPGAD